MENMQGEGSRNSKEQYRFCYLERPRIIICRFNKFKDKKKFSTIQETKPFISTKIFQKIPWIYKKFFGRKY